MNVNFGKDAKPVEAPTQALVPVTAQPVATTTRTFGDRLPAFSEVVFPRLNLVQNMGKLKDTFEPGDIVLGQQVVLFETPINSKTGEVIRKASAPPTITVLGLYPTRFVEKVEWGVQPIILNSEDEVAKYNGTLDFKEWQLKKATGIKKFDPVVDSMVLIERPETSKDDDTVFIFAADGKKYAIAKWLMKGGAYTKAAKGVFLTQRGIGCLRNGYPTHSFSVTTRYEDYPGDRHAWVPICVPATKSGPELLELAYSILSGVLTPPSVNSAD